MSKTLVLSFRGSKQEFGEYLDFIDAYLEQHPDVTLGEIASNEVFVK